jgi:hypothetical protein
MAVVRQARPDPVEVAVDDFLHRHPGATVEEVADHLWQREQQGDFSFFGPLDEQARRFRVDETTRLLVRLRRLPLGARRYFVTTHPRTREYYWYPWERGALAAMGAEERKAALDRHERLLFSAPFTMITNTLAVLKFLGMDPEEYRAALHDRLDEAVDRAHDLAASASTAA